MITKQKCPQGRVQAIRPIYKCSPTAAPTTPPPDSEIVHIDVYPADNETGILLWEDVQYAFKGAVNIRYGTRVLSFMKDKDLKRYFFFLV
jgi:hypothetical protein